MNSAPGTTNTASRRHPRARVDIPVELSLGSDSSQESARCVDLSIGGMRVRVNEATEPGTALHVQLAARGTPLDLTARVVWCERAYQDGELLGLAFEDLPAAEACLGPLVAQLRAKRSWERASL